MIPGRMIDSGAFVLRHTTSIAVDSAATLATVCPYPSPTFFPNRLPLLFTFTHLFYFFVVSCAALVLSPIGGSLYCYLALPRWTQKWLLGHVRHKAKIWTGR